MSSVKISIITVTRNCEKTIGECLASVAAQTFQRHEHVIVDGSSTDGTLNILQAHLNQISSLISEPDGGIYFAFNKGLAKATGEVVGFLNADDFYAHPNVLAHIAKVFDDPEVSAVYGDLQYISQLHPARVIRQWVSSPFTPGCLAKGWMPPHPTLYVRKKYYQEIGGFDTNYRISADYNSILHLFKLPGFKSKYLPKILVKMRVGGISNRSLRNILLKSREDYKALRMSNVGVLNSYGAVFCKNITKFKQFFNNLL
jgi:glycosyltransferase